jgi:RimJ/RimL family protein N-acetyltransferase
MLKFLTTDSLSSEKIAERLALGEEREEIIEIIDSFIPFTEEGCSFGFAVAFGCLLVRIFDGGEYAFVYPIALVDECDERAAIEEIAKYAAREEISLTFCDVDEIGGETLEDIFRFTESYGDGDSLAVRVHTELSRLEIEPTVFDGELSLSPLTDTDSDDYGRLCLDRDLNKYWGYDYKEDNPDADGEYFLKAARAGFDSGSSLSLAVRLNGEFIGEATLWGFDFKGSASLGFRLLPEYHGKGLGKKTLKLILSLGDEIGLKEIKASVKVENIPSLRILEREMDFVLSENNVNNYLHIY